MYLWELASALAESGIEVEILTWAGPLPVPDYVSPRVKIYAAPAVRYYQSLISVPFLFFRLLFQKKCDHIFVHFAGYGEGIIITLLRLLRKTPFSIVFHYPKSQVPHRYEEFKKWQFDFFADHLIGVSKATTEEVAVWSGRTCAVIGHGVDTDRFRPNSDLREETRDLLKIPFDANVLISVAALEERKGIQWAIRALPKVIEKKPNTFYLVIGDGPYRAELCKLISELGLGEQVKMLGFLRDIPKYLQASDIMVSLSYGEASSISLLEAMATGLPSITAEHRPYPELVQNDWGIMVDEKSTDLLAEQILHLINSPSLRELMGEKARECILIHHDWKNIAAHYYSLIHK